MGADNWLLFRTSKKPKTCIRFRLITRTLQSDYLVFFNRSYPLFLLSVIRQAHHRQIVKLLGIAYEVSDSFVYMPEEELKFVVSLRAAAGSHTRCTALLTCRRRQSHAINSNATLRKI